MYEYIKGIVTDKGTDYAVVENAGMGYYMNCSANTLDSFIAGDSVMLFLYMYVAEDAMELYGFRDRQEREFFMKLISISGIGKKTALAVLSHLTVSDVAMAVVTENVRAFDPVPGIGKKTAQRIILELREKVSVTQTEDKKENPKDAMRKEAIEALIALGFEGIEAGRAVTGISDSEFENTQKLIKLALSAASGK